MGLCCPRGWAKQCVICPTGVHVQRDQREGISAPPHRRNEHQMSSQHRQGLEVKLWAVRGGQNLRWIHAAPPGK